MKNLRLLCAACLLALAGCSVGPSTAPTPTPVAAATPTPTPLVAATPVVTARPPAPSETPAPVETEPVPSDTALPEETPPEPTATPEPEGWDGELSRLTLNDFPTQLTSGPDVLGGTEPIYLIAQLPESDTWLYGLNNAKSSGLILRVAEQWKHLDVNYLTPQALMPTLAYGDFDGDLDLELALLVYLGGGTGSSAWDLHIIEFGPNGAWTDNRFDSADYSAIIDQSVLCSYDAATNLALLTAGESTLELDLAALGYPEPGGPVSSGRGGFISFEIEGDAITGHFSVSVSAPAIPTPGLENVADLEASVVYTGTSFGLAGLTLALA